MSQSVVVFWHKFDKYINFSIAIKYKIDYNIR